MAKYLKPILILLFIFIFSTRCFAEDTELYNNFIKGAPSEFSDKSIDEINSLATPESDLSTIYNSFLKCLKSAMKLAVSICFTIMLSVFLKGVQSDFASIKSTYTIVVFISITALCFPYVKETLTLVKESIDSTGIFCSSAVPVIVTLCVSSGDSFSSVVFSTSVSFVSAVLQKISHNLLVPLTCVFLSFALLGKISKNYNFLSVDTQIKKFIKWVITTFVTLFSFIMSLQNFLSISSDSVLKRSVKNAVGAFIPVVGSTLTSSVDSMFIIASNTKTVFSVSGIVILLFIFLPTGITCLCYGFSLSISKSFALIMNENDIASVIGSVADLFYILCGICASCVIMMIVSFLLVCFNFK